MNKRISVQKYMKNVQQTAVETIQRDKNAGMSDIKTSEKMQKIMRMQCYQQIQKEWACQKTSSMKTNKFP